MQVEHPHAPPASLREFIRQYAMIVLSILTALALERAVIDLHDRGAARDSRVRIEAEIAGNLAELKTRAGAQHDQCAGTSRGGVQSFDRADESRQRQ